MQMNMMNMTCLAEKNISLPTDLTLVNLTYYAIGCIFLSVVGAVANSLLLFIVAKNTEMREKSHALVSCLAFADLFTCVGVFLAATATFLGYDKNISQKCCLLIQGFGIFWSSVDNMMILLIGIDRIFLLRRAIRYI
jgi:hypothetical protein